jgi:transposase
MEAKKGNAAKRQALLQSGTLNKSAAKVVDPKFKNMAFFDPNDILQVKYEMLRSAQKDGARIQQASKTFGFSRITFYKTEKAFKKSGLVGILPQKKGPRRAHKLSGEVMEFVSQLIEQKPDIKSDVIREEIKDRFNLSVHRRSIERAIEKSKKKHPKT